MYRIEAAGDKIHYIDDEEKRDAFLPLENFMGMYETGNPPSIQAEEIKNAVISPVGKG